MKLFIDGLRSGFPRSKIWLLFGSGQEKNFREMLGEGLRSDGVLFVQAMHFKAMGMMSYLLPYLTSLLLLSVYYVGVTDLMKEVPEADRSTIIASTSGESAVKIGLMQLLQSARYCLA
jgi:hypothetical protein